MLIGGLLPAGVFTTPPFNPNPGAAYPAPSGNDAPGDVPVFRSKVTTIDPLVLVALALLAFVVFRK